MKRTNTLLLCAAGVLTGCPGDQTVYLHDANNFSYVGTIDAPSVETASGVSVEICWDQLTSDIQCHEVAPESDIGILTLARFSHLSEEEVEEDISTDSMLQSDLSGFLEHLPAAGETCAQLEDFSLQGTEVDLAVEYTEAGGTYLLLLGSGTEAGLGTRVLTFLAPSESSENTQVDIEDGCGVLDFEADLSSLSTVSVEPEGESWVVDWGDLTTNGLGNVLSLSNIDQLFLAHYPDLGVADLEEQFLDIELVASELWRLDLSGTFSADLAEAQGDSGAFGGFSSEGSWVLALMCTTCSNPAPLFLTLLDPQEG